MEVSPVLNASINDDAKAVTAFQAAVPPVKAEQQQAMKEVLSQVSITDDYQLPTARMDAARQITMTAASTGEQVQTSAGKLMDAMATGEAKILPGSTSERVMLEANGEIYIIVGNFAHMVINGALEVAGYFGVYQLTSAVSGGRLVLFDDDEPTVVVQNLDGTDPE